MGLFSVLSKPSRAVREWEREQQKTSQQLAADYSRYRDDDGSVCGRGQGWTDQGWRAHVADHGGPV